MTCSPCWRRVTEIIVAPVCWLEIQSALARRVREKTLTKAQRDWINTELKIDFNYFRTVKWGEALEKRAAEYLATYSLKTLDSIQLSSAHLSAADVFITSDKQLSVGAKKELKSVRLIV